MPIVGYCFGIRLEPQAAYPSVRIHKFETFRISSTRSAESVLSRPEQLTCVSEPALANFSYNGRSALATGTALHAANPTSANVGATPGFVQLDDRAGPTPRPNGRQQFDQKGDWNQGRT
jgi:hypothetical protein